MPRTIDELIQDERFSKLSPKDQQDIVMKFYEANPKGKYEQGEASISKKEGLSNFGATPDSVREEREDEVYGGYTPQQRLLGALGGAAKGGLMGIPGGPAGMGAGALGGGAMGGMFPPTTKGQWAAEVASAPLGALGGMATKAVQGPAAKVGVAGLSGLLSTLGLNGVQEAVDKTGNPVLPDVQKNPMSILPMLMGAIPPMAGQQLINNTTKARPLNVSRELMQDVTGKSVKISDMPALETLQHTSPEIAQMVAAGQKPTPQQIANDILQKRTQKNLETTAQVKAARKTRIAELSVDKQVNLVDKAQKELETKRRMTQIGAAMEPKTVANAGANQIDLNVAQMEERKGRRGGESSWALDKRDLNTTNKRNTIAQTRAELLRMKAEQEVYGNEAANLGEDVKRKNAGIGVDQKGEAWKLAQTQEREVKLKQSLDSLKADANSLSKAMHPDLGKLNDPAIVTGNDLLKKLGSTDISGSGVDAYRKRIQSELGAKGVKTFEDGMVQEMFAQMYDPKTKTLSNAPKVFGRDGTFSPEKILATYGNGPDAAAKLKTIQQGVEAIQSLQGGPTALQNFGKSLGAHMAWVLPNMIVFHPEVLATTVGSAAALTGTVGMAVAYPKLIDAMLKKPKMGELFYRWSTSSTRTGRSLSNWPRLASWMKSISEPASAED